MPFGKRKQGNKFQVVNTETGDVKGTHDSEADADKQLAALHANDADKDKGHMDIRTKAVAATITDTSSDADEFPGTFLVELSNESLDRDGDILKADEWETPLPEQITFVNDHTHKMASVVGSATPELVGGKILCKGEWAATQTAQDTRKVIKHVPYTSVTYREKRDQKAGTVSRELINGAFVVVPSNTKARVLASKSFDELDDETKEFIETIVKSAVADTLKQISVLTGVDIKGLSPAPDGAPSKDADPQADPAKDETAALAHAKAAAFQITSQSRQFTEGEMQNA
jgi:hypothetical protein